MTTLMKYKNGLNLLPELPLVFNDTVLRDWFNWTSLTGGAKEGNTVPAVNIRETDHNYEILVAAPGMTKNDFKVELDNNRLIISGERKQEAQNNDDNFLRKEFSYQSFVRTFTLSEKQVNGSKIQARYADGVLNITVPKSEEIKSKPAQVIQIS